MATRLRKQIARAVANAIRARDRAEIRAMNALLSLVESPHKTSRPPNTRRRKAQRRRIARRRP